ncbi:MAG: PRTRC system protein C [Capnocytophaga sp.]|nr:PRTRC system protein C [Capnocytophaga sp.]
MLIATQLKRVFLFKNNGQETRLDDPNREWSVEMVQHFYAPTYPILTTAKVSAPRVNGEYVEYHFETSIGTKG